MSDRCKDCDCTGAHHCTGGQPQGGVYTNERRTIPNDPGGGTPEKGGRRSAHTMNREKPTPDTAREAVEREFQQVLGLSSCATDGHGNDCDLCVEQIHRYRDACLQQGKAEAYRELGPLARLGLWAIEEEQDGHHDLNGGDVQDKATEFGVIAPIRVTESCGDHCQCDEYDNIPGDCFRLTESTSATKAWLAQRGEG